MFVFSMTIIIRLRFIPKQRVVAMFFSEGIEIRSKMKRISAGTFFEIDV